MYIKLDKFQGPLGLLLRLIEKEEMDITEVSLAKIADQYIDYIKSSSNIRPDEIADFLVVAAKLLLIKSKALLPYLQPAEEEEIEELEQQLKMYKEFLEVMKKVKNLIQQKKFMFAREFSKRVLLANVSSSALFRTGIFSPPKKLLAKDLAAVFMGIINSLEPEQKLAEEKLEHKINIEDKILAIQQMLINRIKLSFNNVIANTKSKTEIVVSFLAILELIKQKEVAVTQDSLFSDILISRNSNV